MKQFTFKDGFKCVASTKEEAIAKHKVCADKNEAKIFKHFKTTASANSKQFSYKGQVINASSKEEAIKQITKAYFASEVMFRGNKTVSKEFDEHAVINDFKSGNVVISVIPKSIEDKEYKCVLNIQLDVKNKITSSKSVFDAYIDKNTKKELKDQISKILADFNVTDPVMTSFRSNENKVSVTFTFGLLSQATPGTVKKIAEKVNYQLSFLDKLK